MAGHAKAAKHAVTKLTEKQKRLKPESQMNFLKPNEIT
jgi:hypothetical protein